MNKNKFKKDDIVLCVDNSAYQYIKLYKKYKICNIPDDIFIVLINDNNVLCSYNKKNFITLKDLRKQKINKILNEI
jgi:hypothetical protein